jgi:DNA-3-methyladenine glycosylase II
MIPSHNEKQLIKLDPTLGKIIKANGHVNLRPERDYFEALASSIVSQQISVKAAAKIFARFRDTTKLDPTRVLEIDEPQQKAIGLSGQKLRYLHSLAEHFVEDSAVFNHLESLNDDEVIVELTRVKGIGVWTAQMFLIFTLRRPDIFAPDDRGLQLAIQNIYDLPKLPGRAELEQFAEKWAPYRSIACLHLWRSLDNTPG